MALVPSDHPAVPRFRVFTAFQYPQYSLFWLGGAFSNVGMWALIFGRLWLMRNLTDSVLMLGLVTLSSLGPVLLLSVWGGVIADRVNRLRLVTITRALFAALAFLTGVLIVTDVIQPWQLLAISVGTGILLSFDIPCRQAILPNLVPREHLVNAITLYSLLFGGAAIVGPTFFAPLVKLGGIEGLFFLIGIAYLLTVAMLMIMKPLERRASPSEGSLWQGLLQGLSYIRSHQAIVTLIGLGIIGGIFGMSFETLLPVFADEILEGDVETYSYLLLSIGVGAMAGVMVLAWLGNLKNSVRFLILGGVGFGVGLVAFARISWFPGSVIAIGAVGAFSVMFLAINTTLVQSLVDDAYRGRVMSIHQLATGAHALGGLLMGFLAHLVDAPFALTLGGLVMAGATGTLVLSALRGLSVAVPLAKQETGKAEALGSD